MIWRTSVAHGGEHMTAVGSVTASYSHLRTLGSKKGQKPEPDCKPQDSTLLMLHKPKIVPPTGTRGSNTSE